ncbi:MAG: N-acetyltransferase [Arthrobacter sp.]|jgi:predicted N-acetyltransferase YhbS|nr:N-acetyltransferase [Arthrobacter sp.]
MTPTSHAFTTRPERPGDEAAIRAVNIAAFPGKEEADLVDALRRDPEAWVPGLSTVTHDASGKIIGHALLTRCTVGGEPALALAPCAVVPAWQGRGAGSAAIRAALAAATECAAAGGENLVVVLGHAAYYPRFGFTPAAGWGVTGPFEVPEDHFLALALDTRRPTPRGEIAYPEAFGV